MGQRKKFDKAFKEQVVLRILAKESTVGDTANELLYHQLVIDQALIRNPYLYFVANFRH
ncbi:hypothetical protein ACFPYJ_32415 [Paenibacillus solisilvae]|uniref:Transposase n=1 Tax=Paenibacillus solisilvae TaxID=2486751 RepID=A0ABW0W6J9_9BACL